MVVALLMIINGEIKEHRIQESMSMCLKGEKMRRPGAKGAPTKKAFVNSAKTAKKKPKKKKS